MGKTKYPLCLICPAPQGSHAFMSLHVSPGLPEVKLCTFEKNSTLSRAVGMSRAVWDPELLHEVTQRRVYQCQMRDLYLCPPPDPCSFIPRPQINSALLLWSFRLWLPSWGFLAWMQVIFNSWGLWLLSPDSLVLTSQTCFRQPPVRDGGIGTEGGGCGLSLSHHKKWDRKEVSASSGCVKSEKGSWWLSFCFGNTVS